MGLFSSSTFILPASGSSERTSLSHHHSPRHEDTTPRVTDRNLSRPARGDWPRCPATWISATSMRVIESFFATGTGAAHNVAQPKHRLAGCRAAFESRICFEGSISIQRTRRGKLDPSAPQVSVLWWLVAAWLACNAVVPVVCMVSMVAGYLRRKFGSAPQPEDADRMAAD